MVLPGILPRRLFVRLIAVTDGSPLGLLGLEYLKSILSITTVRLFSLSGFLDGGWERYGGLMSLPLVGAFVNVVCTPPQRWSWMQGVEMPNKDGTTTAAAERRELYTPSSRNVLITDYQPAAARDDRDGIGIPDPAHSARKYEAIIVPTAGIRDAWDAFGCHARVVPVPVVDHAPIRELILPA
jgi:hypothetical protein